MTPMANDRPFARPLARRTRALALSLAALWIASLSFGANAQGAWPNKTVRIVSPSSAGGPTDLLARVLAEKLQLSLRQPVVVEAKPGASSVLGTDVVAKAPADGYTIGIVSIPFVVTPRLMKALPYDAEADFTPVALVATSPYVLLTHPSRPYANLAELVKHAKERPDEVTYASSGIGTGQHLMAEWLKLETGTRLRHIQYSGSAQPMSDLIGGHVDLLFSPPNAAVQHIKAGSLRALAVTGTRRSPTLAEVPTAGEQAYPKFRGLAWFGLLVRNGTPADVVQRLNAEVNTVLKQPDVLERFKALGLDAEGGSAAAFGEVIKSERETWARVLKDGGGAGN